MRHTDEKNQSDGRCSSYLEEAAVKGYRSQLYDVPHVPSSGTSACSSTAKCHVHVSGLCDAMVGMLLFCGYMSSSYRDHVVVHLTCTRLTCRCMFGWLVYIR